MLAREVSDPVAQTVRTSKVQIVDLAGSERLKPYEQGSQNDKDRQAESAHHGWVACQADLALARPTWHVPDVSAKGPLECFIGVCLECLCVQVAS